jgi:hypothetical protein
VSTARLQIPEAELAKLQGKLAALGGVHQSQVLLNGMRAAGRVVRNRAEELAPAGKDEDRGERASIKTDPAWKVKAFVRDDEPLLEVRVKAAKRAPHLHLVELGHEVVTGGTVPRIKGGKTPQARDPKKTGQGRRTGKRTRAAEFLSRGGKYSEAQQIAELNKAALKAIQKLIGG